MSSVAASPAVIEGIVVDAADNEPLAACAVAVAPGRAGVSTDPDGRFRIVLRDGGPYTLTAAYVGYDDYRTTFSLRGDTSVVVRMTPRSEQLREITVTARESAGATTSSRIDRDAMSHLQPSSFTDLLELLPGNISHDPRTGAFNAIKLRETGTVGASGTEVENPDYSMTSLGTVFNVDGAPVSNDAGHQSIGIEASIGRNGLNRGVDMRSLATDNIESVEIVRGIPSAEYGNLTSGVVNIRRTRRATPLSARFKADGYSKLFYVGKGLAVGPDGRNTVNADLGWLDSRSDPRNSLENYRRITASVRASLQWERPSLLATWDVAADYTGTADRSKSDPDISLIRIDRYDSDSHRASLTSALSLNFRSLPWLRRVDFRASAAYARDRLSRERQVAPSRPVVAPISSSPGVHDGVFITEEYISHYISDGKPLSIFARLSLGGAVPVWNSATQNYKAGLEWTMDKNYGRGQVYDPMKPLSASWTSRPRAYKDIPALNTVSFYAEDNLTTATGYGSLELQAGFHGIVMAGLDRRYALAGKVYIDPRLNAVWRLPAYTVGHRSLELFLAGGYGTTTRMPTADYLYPQAAYLDLLQLNYFNAADPSASRVNIRTYVNDATNYGLRAARNHKWEVRAGAQLGAAAVSVTYFEERMNSGFRYSSVYGAYEYTKYDSGAIVPGASAPSLDGLPSTQERVLRGYRRAENGSRIDKRGVEFQLTTPRWRPLATSLTVTGAWFRTLYSNSQMLFDPVDDVVGGTAVSDRYVGLYDTNDGRVNEQFNTNFMFDTQIPRFGLVFTTTVQCMWYVKSRRLRQDGTPKAYLDAIDGLLHEFDSAQADAQLAYLVRHYNEALFDTYTVPPALYLNLKVSKTIGRWLRVAVFVNRIVDYLPSYTRNGLTVRRSADAYFGMELNFTL